MFRSCPTWFWSMRIQIWNSLCWEYVIPYDSYGLMHGKGTVAFRDPSIIPRRIPIVKLKIPGKAFLKSESENYNLNVTEVPYPTFPMLFHGIFNFPVGILRWH